MLTGLSQLSTPLSPYHSSTQFCLHTQHALPPIPASPLGSLSSHVLLSTSTSPVSWSKTEGLFFLIVPESPFLQCHQSIQSSLFSVPTLPAWTAIISQMGYPGASWLVFLVCISIPLHGLHYASGGPETQVGVVTSSLNSPVASHCL